MQKTNVKMELEKLVMQIVSQLGGGDISVVLEHPVDVSHGDFTTNVSFALSKKLKKSPMEVAEELAKKLTMSFRATELSSGVEESNTTGSINRFERDPSTTVGMTSIIEKVEAVKPGFVNFWLSEELLGAHLQEMLRSPEEIGRTTHFSGKKVVFEFTDANPFKEFHIGHVYTNTVGESLCRIFGANGAIVWRADYFGDVGMHVAKSLWGLEEKFREDSIDLSQLSQRSLPERIKYLGQAYAKGATAYEENPSTQEEMKVINRLTYIAAQKMWQKKKGLEPQIDYRQGVTIDEKQYKRIYELYTTGREWSMEYFETVFARLGMKFDGYYPESIAGERGYKLVKEHIEDGVFEEHEGAVVFRGETRATSSGQNLHTRVFINSLGLPTYEAKELGLAPWKYEDFAYDKSIIVTGNEIREYFKVLIAAMTAINPELGQKTMHLPHGMVRLPEGKMSSRTGKIVTGEWLIDEAVKKAGELGKESSTTPEIAEQVGIGAVKYAFLKSSIGKDVEFDFETSLSLNGNSGPYLQYTYVRTQSIAEKAKQAQIEGNYPSNYTPTIEETTLLRTLVRYKDVLESAAEHLSPSTVCTYLYDLAKLYNLFYQNNRILTAQTEEEKKFRLLLTQGVGIILSAGLNLLGIEAPKRM